MAVKLDVNGPSAHMGRVGRVAAERQRRSAAEISTDVSRGQNGGDPKNLHRFRKNVLAGPCGTKSQ